MALLRGGFVVMLAVAALVGACGIVIGLEPPQETQRPPPPLPPPPPPPILDPCAHTGAPAKPATDDDPSAAVPPFWLAMRATRIAGDAGVRGFDLDGVCTCDHSEKAAHDGGASCLPRGGAAVECDDDGGVDNAAERVFRSAGAFADPNAGLAKDIGNGQKTMLIYVANYNGKKNDADVTVGFALSDGLLTNECDPALEVEPGDAGTCEAGAYCTPTWRGCDRWHPAQNALIPLPPPDSVIPLRNGKAYVTDGVLVATGNADIPFFINKTSMLITGPTFTARLEEVMPLSPTHPRRFRMREALLGGRLPLDDLARVLWEGSFGDFFFCESLGIYKETMRQACPHVDTNKFTGLDFQEGLACNAMSLGIPVDMALADIDLGARVAPTNTPNERCVGKPVPALSETCPP